MIELFIWKWGLYLLIIYGFIANACATPTKIWYWESDKPLKGTNEFKKDYKRPYWKCVKNCYGFIAQDVETIFPDCIDDTKPPGSDILYESGDEIPEGKEIGDVKEEGEEQKNLNYNYLFSHLVKAVQELSAKVTALENAWH